MWTRDITRLGLLATGLLALTAVGALAAGQALPRWDQVAFVSARDRASSDIYLVEVDRGLTLNLTGHLSGEFVQHNLPAWSPDGRWLAFTSNYHGSLQIFVMEADTGESHPLLAPGLLTSPYWQPVWSPDGRWLAFKSYAGAVGDSQIFLTDDAGKTVRQITEAGVVNFSWSPDSQRIAFFSTGSSLNIGGFILILDIDRPDSARFVTAHVDILSHLDWSPDGSKIAFESTLNGRTEIFAIDIATSRQINLSNSAANDSGAVWSPDGKQVAFYSDRDGDLDLYVVNSDARNLRRLTDTPSDDWGQSWSPDGRRLAFVRHSSGGSSEIYVVNGDGTGLRRLTDNDVDDWQPVWRPRGE